MTEQWGGYQSPPADAEHIGSSAHHPAPSPGGAGSAGSLLRRIARGALSGGPLVVLGSLLFVLFSLSPYYRADTNTGSVAQNCGRITDPRLHKICVHETLGSQSTAVSYHWNGWHRLISWPPIVLFLLLALVVAAKGLAARPNKVRLGTKALGLVIVADVLFLIAFYDMPNSYMGRAWGIWVSLILVLFITAGALLTFVDLRPLADKALTSAARGDHQPTAAQRVPGYPPPGQPPTAVPPSGYLPTSSRRPPGCQPATVQPPPEYQAPPNHHAPPSHQAPSPHQSPGGQPPP